MIITCPKCGTQYNVDENQIPKGTKKMRCANCGFVFSYDNQEEMYEIPAETVLKEKNPVVQEEPIELADKVVQEEAAPKPELPKKEEKPEPESSGRDDGKKEPSFDKPEENDNDMQEIFARISSKNEEIDKHDKQTPAFKRILNVIKKYLGLRSKQNRIIFGILLLCILVLYLFYAKYDIVRVFPAAEKIYSSLDIESVVVGEGLDFQNVTRREYEEDYVKKLEIKGFIVNKTAKKLRIPVIHVALLDKETVTLQGMNAKATLDVVEPLDRVAFNIVINKPSSFTKYILLTFIRENAEAIR